jgi:hypothetical protein
MLDIQDLNGYLKIKVLDFILFLPCSIELTFGSLRDCCSDLGRLGLGAYSTEQLYSFPILNRK